MLEFLKPVEHFGRKFDRAMILFEFDAFREPERTRFPLIGAWLRERCEFVEVPTPSMLWRGKMLPDPFISNRLDGVPTGVDFDQTFLEPMCLKITGRSYAEMCHEYHRALWLPLYWEETLRARESLCTTFFYPRVGYAGSVLASLENIGRPFSGHRHDTQDTQTAEIRVAYVIAPLRAQFSVLFVVDESPIYRITDQDACAGLDPKNHRYIVEYRGACNVVQALERLELTYHAWHIAFDSFRLPLPTLENVANGWKPRPTINDQLWSLMHEPKT